ncbi:PRORP1 [Symbiodinium necroappetens]|uniref:PRORP1 protein n=1 Tax=Symbiodinium necroappetens TaxID=1628268 RepID=A0A812VCM9_9DINO|nr:PRORP1 [Symbiodinium necroappetens]
MVIKLAIDGVKNSGKRFKRFKKWLEEQPPFDIVIDGANVGFNNQNREGGLFQYSQIDAVIKKLRETGSRVLLVLHPKWLRADADRTVTKRKKRKLDQINLESGLGSSDESAEEHEDGEPEIQYPFDPITDAERAAPSGTPLAFIRQWKESDCLVRVPAKDCDDWYWLFAALSSARRGARHVQVVSNDHMRDHHWRMVGNRAFLKWQGRHMTRVSIWSETSDAENCKVTLTPPDLYSVQAQVCRAPCLLRRQPLAFSSAYSAEPGAAAFLWASSPTEGDRVCRMPLACRMAPIVRNFVPESDCYVTCWEGVPAVDPGCEGEPVRLRWSQGMFIVDQWPLQRCWWKGLSRFEEASVVDGTTVTRHFVQAIRLCMSNSGPLSWRSSNLHQLNQLHRRRYLAGMKRTSREDAADWTKLVVGLHSYCLVQHHTIGIC